MKKEMLKALEDYWTCGRDNAIIKDFIIYYFDNQPERSKREDCSMNFIYKTPECDKSQPVRFLKFKE